MRKKRSDLLRFTRLKLRNWRNFDDIEIFFGERAFFVGPNASRKSNLLDVFRFLGEIAAQGRGGMRAAFEKRSGLPAVRNLNARNPSDIVIEVDVGSRANLRQWTYLLRVNIPRGEREPSVLEERVCAQSVEVRARIRNSRDDPFLFSQTFLEQNEISQNFRPLCDFFASCRYLHVVPQIVRERERARQDGDDPYGGDLLRRMSRLPEKSRSARLKRISVALKIAVPQFEQLELQKDSESVPHLLASYVHWRPNVSKQSESAFSDGTLRLIGLLWAISEGGGPLLLEEPELSLNDAIVSQLPSMFARMQVLSNRQVLVTTHSTALLDNPGIGLAEVHVIVNGVKGSTVQTASRNEAIVAQVEGGLTIAEAILPLTRPKGAEKLGQIDVAA